VGNPAAPNVEQFKAAVNVTPFWNEGVVNFPIRYAPWYADGLADSPLKPPCEHLKNSLVDNILDQNTPDIPSLRTITIFCPSRYAELGQKPSGGSV
jgi:hypothetical protein